MLPSSLLNHEKVRVGQSQTGVEVRELDLSTGHRPVAVVVQSARSVVVNNEVVEIGRACTDVEGIGRQRPGCCQFGEDGVLQLDLVNAHLKVGNVIDVGQSVKGCVEDEFVGIRSP